jgi:hypothetical protein
MYVINKKDRKYKSELTEQLLMVKIQKKKMIFDKQKNGLLF